MGKQISVFYLNNFSPNARCLSFRFAEIKDNPSTKSSSSVRSVGCPDRWSRWRGCSDAVKAIASNTGREINGYTLDYFWNDGPAGWTSPSLLAFDRFRQLFPALQTLLDIKSEENVTPN